MKIKSFILQNFLLHQFVLGFVAQQRTNGDWQTSTGDLVSLVGNEITIFGTDGSVTNGIVVITDDDGFTSISQSLK